MEDPQPFFYGKRCDGALALKYSTRIISLLDGKITDDTNPCTKEEAKANRLNGRKAPPRTRVSFFTSLGLSFSNLRNKRGRTVLTSLAGSIGIIGIALILALSQGVNTYIDNIQKSTMASYPLNITEQSINMSQLMNMGLNMTTTPFISGGSSAEDAPTNGIYSDYSELKSAKSTVLENNLTAFKEYLEDPRSDIHQYIGKGGIVYSYNLAFDVYTYDGDDVLLNTDSDVPEVSGSNSSGYTFMTDTMMGMMSMSMGTGGVPSIFGSESHGASNFSQLLPGIGGEPISDIILDSYELLYGEWPEEENEIVLVLDENNRISADTLYKIGLITEDEYREIAEAIADDDDPDELDWKYKEVCDKTYYLIPASDFYRENDNDTFTFIDPEEEDSVSEIEKLIEDALELEVTGVIRPIPDAENAVISTPFAFTTALSDYIIEHNNGSEVVKAQEKTPKTNVLTGLPFETKDDAQKAEDAKTYLAGLSEADKAEAYTMIMNAAAYKAEQDGEQTLGGRNVGSDDASKAAALDKWLENTPDEDLLVYIYDKVIGDTTYEDNLEAFGKVDYDAPSSINIYTDRFDDKEMIAKCIKAYNDSVDEDEQISYTDYVALMTSSLTTIVNVISYVLIAFVAVALIVSCVMIGIITHISVLERTKEIGVLRALGASKANVSHVFVAETVLIGFFSGVVGIGVSYLLIFPLNSVIHKLINDTSASASLPIVFAAGLIVLSILITVLGGILPAHAAARKDPVAALRSE